MFDKTRTMLDRHDPADDAHNRVLHVWTAEDAFLTIPTGYWVNHLASGVPENTRRGAASDRMLMASVCQSFRYLIANSTKEEAWRKIKLLREVLDNEPTDDHG